MTNNLTIRSLIKKNIDYILHPIGLTIERYFGDNLDLKKIIKIANSLEIDLLLDIGANRGQYAERMIKSGFNKKILSFEPLNDAHKELSILAGFYTNWDVYQKCAVGDIDGIAQIQISENEYSSSILKVNPNHLSIAPQAKTIKSETVNLIRLDSISDKLDARNLFIKIDTQGFEDRVLHGCSEKILKRTEVIQIELSLLELYSGSLRFDQMISFLKNLGFEPLFFSPGFTDRSTNEIQQLDGFFIRSGLKK